MPKKVDVFDKGDGTPENPPRKIRMWSVAANEAIAHDKARYSLTKPKNFDAPVPAKPVARPAPAAKPATTPAPAAKPATTPAPAAKPATTPAPVT